MTMSNISIHHRSVAKPTRRQAGGADRGSGSRHSGSSAAAAPTVRGSVCQVLLRARFAQQLLVASLIVNAAAAAESPDAPDAPEPTDQVAQLSEVIVTAQKRSESVINVPISMTVLGPAELEARRVVKLEDYILSIPNVTFTDYGTFSPVVSIRGVGSQVGGQFDPIGVTVDDISYGTTETDVINSARFFDLERIEVLRGPQGTLTGTNSVGGSINYISVAPSVEAAEVKGTVEYARFNTLRAKGVLNVPLTNTLALRTVVYDENSDGAVTNIGASGGDSGYHNDGARVALRWLATDKFTVDASFAAEQQRRGLDNHLYSSQVWGDPGAAQARQLASSYGVPWGDPALPFIQSVGNNGGNVSFDSPEHHYIDNQLGSLKLTYEVANQSLQFMYGYFHHSHEGLMDYDATEYAAEKGSYNRYDTSNSYEVRDTSKLSGPFNWVFGLSYHDENNPYNELDYAGITDANGNYVKNGNYQFDERWNNYQRLLTRAVYGNVFWDITSRLHLSAGARYNRSVSEYGEYGVYGVENADVPLPPSSWIPPD